jgi:hypothetical protein
MQCWSRAPLGVQADASTRNSIAPSMGRPAGEAVSLLAGRQLQNNTVQAFVNGARRRLRGGTSEESTMSDPQIRQASFAALLARLHTLSVSTNAEDRAEAMAIQREIRVRLECGDA